ncbi:VIT1/CCC1 transporter family protein [Simkania negevensis]|uniref:Putative membrane protein n=1 Tax=Simkania negevensis (strain ATCC VR-1471 / DSM 27360 / Z) TaxID=331113 RepID=F8L6R8_SIMNZ|nr:VIT1/CCC1 transporter family protein [Simkania negevensis]CCB88416.1 putative membrane protein [Simkania negevensis Z]
MTLKSDHFKGKDVYEHLKEARARGAKATQEIHGTEAPGHLVAATDSLKETAIVLLGFWILLLAFRASAPVTLLAIFSIGWILWKGGRSALLGWGRLERLHRLIEEERYEIQHHRAQEKKELRGMYEQKGFTGELLDQVVEVLMADDNRLLRVMLEEELGLTLETYEHPLKQAVGAAVGAFIAGIGALIGAFFAGMWGITIVLFLLFSIATLVTAKREGNALIKSLIWNLAVGILSIGTLYFISQLR